LLRQIFKQGLCQVRGIVITGEFLPRIRNLICLSGLYLLTLLRVGQYYGSLCDCFRPPSSSTFHLWRFIRIRSFPFRTILGVFIKLKLRHLHENRRECLVPKRVLIINLWEFKMFSFWNSSEVVFGFSSRIDVWLWLMTVTLITLTLITSTFQNVCQNFNYNYLNYDTLQIK